MDSLIRTKKLKWLWPALLAATIGCAKPEGKTYPSDDGSGTSGGGGVVSNGGGSSQRLVTIPVQLVDKTGSGGLSLLASATTFTVSLEGCATGYTSTADENSTALQVYKFDRGCLAKLTQFEFGGHTLIPTAAHPFTTWAAGDLATFDEAGEPGTYATTVKVLSQLADPVSGTESIVYQFAELTKGADSGLLEATVGDAHSLTVDSQPPPSFTIRSVAYTGVNANGGGQFVFTMECTSAIGGTDVCESVDMADLKYKLVEDTYSSTLVIGDANALFPAGATAVAMPGDREAPGGATVKGGFHTVTLDGPDEMANHLHMIFIMQANGTSYQYFNVDVADLTQD